MKIKISVYVYLVILTSFSCYAQEITEDGIKFTLKAKLKKNYQHDCDCQSRIISNKMFDFRIIESNMEEYYLKDINIIIQCPEGYGDDFFKKGSIYKIEFYDNCTDMSIDQGVCDNDFPKHKKMKRRFWVHSIVKIE
jgi:hypothetical protein